MEPRIRVLRHELLETVERRTCLRERDPVIRTAVHDRIGRGHQHRRVVRVSRQERLPRREPLREGKPSLAHLERQALTLRQSILQCEQPTEHLRIRRSDSPPIHVVIAQERLHEVRVELERPTEVGERCIGGQPLELALAIEKCAECIHRTSRQSRQHGRWRRAATPHLLQHAPRE